MGKYKYKDDMNIDEKLLVASAKVANSWKKNCSSIFKNFGLTYAQYNVLRALRASENGTNTITNISTALLVSGANMTGIAKRMAEGGFILRKSDPSDERRTILEITPRGLKTIQNIDGDLNRLVAHLLQKVPAQRREDTLDALKSILKVSATFKP